MNENWIKDKNEIWINTSLPPQPHISYPDDGNLFYFSMEENSFWFKHRNEVLLQLFKRFPFHGNFADIGGGNGYQAKMIAENFPSIKVLMIEPGYTGCLNARKRGLTEVYNTTFENFDFEENQVGAVGILDVLELIEDDAKFFENLKLKLPAKTYIYITVPAYNFLWSDSDYYGGHYRRYTIKMLKELCRKTEMELVYSSYFFSYIPAPTFLLRSLPYRIRGNRKKDAILSTESMQHNPSQTVLNIFQRINKYELNKVSTSSINFGSSCLAVIKT